MDKEELLGEIEYEVENLKRLEREMNNLLARIGDKPDLIEVRAAASILHDFYCGVEKIFEKIALSTDKNLPKGDNWHSELLLQMAKPFNTIRDAIITEESLENLKKYLDFRHLFRHIYGFELKWERFRDLCLRLDTIFARLKFEIEESVKRLK